MPDTFPRALSALDHLLSAYEESQSRGWVNLVPSENRLTPRAQSLLVTDAYNRYFFNQSLSDDFWEFRGGELLSAVELAGDAALARLACSRFVNTRPTSGMNAMLIAVSSATEPGGLMASILPECGGHFATRSLARRLGLEWLPLRCSGGVIDCDDIEAAISAGASLIYADFQNAIAPLDIPSLVGSVERCRGLDQVEIHVDVSHTLGLILGGAHANPLAAGATSFGGSTHKTFPGPQKGVLFTNRDATAEAWRRAQVDFISSHHYAETLALGIAAMEFQDWGARYARETIDLAQTMQRSLAELGVNVLHTEETMTHQVWIGAGSAEAAYLCSDILASCRVRINVQTRVLTFPYVIRIGTNELALIGGTRRSAELAALAIARALAGHAEEAAAVVADLHLSIGTPFYESMESVCL